MKRQWQAWPVPGAFASVLLALLVVSAGCQHRRAASLGMPTLLGSVAAPLPVVPPASLRTRPDLHLDLNWLDLDAFFPPGARPVGPAEPLGVGLLPAQRVRFPTTELCPSPDQRFVLFHDGMKRKNRDIHHWLLLLRKQPGAYPNAVFATALAFEAGWAADSRHFAITHFTGDNASEVLVFDVADLERHAIDVRPFIEQYFPVHLAPLPMFVQAYRWTLDGQLVVRAIARAQEAPYELYGCELAVAFLFPGAAPRVRFLRGYVKDQDTEPAGGAVP